MARTRSLRLVADGVEKRYGSVRALAGVHLEVGVGEVMALLGENGAGKSTIVKVLAGLVRPDAGTITLDGRAVDLTGSSASQAAGIAVVQQEYSTVGALSVAENLLLGQRGVRRWWSRGFLEGTARDLLARVGLDHVDPFTPVEELSVAEMQLLEIARVLARDATVVVLDEPTAALSDAETSRVLETVRSLASAGTSILFVTHRLKEVFAVADRVTIFRNGTSLAPERVVDMDASGIVSRMLGRDLGEMYPQRAASASSGPPALVVSDLAAPGLAAPVDLEVAPGQVLGLTGQLGAGGSELLRALAGLVPLVSGRVELDGRPLDVSSRRAGIDGGIAYCSPDRKGDGIFAGLSIERNLSSPWLARVTRLGVVARAREREVAEGSARRFALDVSRLSASVGVLSGGNQQKVAVGKWLGLRPRVLLVDEPTRGVDVGARAEIYAQLRALADAGLVVVVQSSDTNEVMGLCDLIGTFHDGVLTRIAPHTGWSEEELVHAVMAGSAVAR